MTLPASGAISIQSLNTEIGQSVNNMNDTRLRYLVNKPTGNSTILMSDFYSKTGSFTGNVTIDSSFRSSAGISGQPIYGTTFVEFIRNSSTGNAEIHFNTAPLWQGSWVLRNNTTGVQTTCAFSNNVNFVGANPANLLRASTTDNFTIRPL